MRHQKSVLMIVFLFVLSSVVFALKPGQAVCAKWGGADYFATVVGIEGSKVNVVYGDGDKAELNSNEVREIPWEPGLKTGDAVLASWNDSAKLYTGTVIEVCQMSYKVKWDDGSAPSWVPATRILKK